MLWFYFEDKLLKRKLVYEGCCHDGDQHMWQLLVQYVENKHGPI